MAPSNRTVLVVTEDTASSEAISTWLRQVGLDVTACRGPQAPSQRCAGGRGQPCPLAIRADLVVVDLRLASDTMLQGTPALAAAVLLP
jgi:CheY-like chemotaxis protein